MDNVPEAPMGFLGAMSNPRLLIRAFKVETGISKDRAAAAAERYSPPFIACIANKRRPACSVKLSFSSERLGEGHCYCNYERRIIIEVNL